MSPPTAATPPPASEMDRRLGHLLRRAGARALAAFRERRELEVRRKADGSPFTEADAAVEAVLVEGLRAAFPGVEVRSEEGRPGPAAGPHWVVDPIDGTAAFVEGLAHWGVTAAFLEPAPGGGLRPVAGGLYLPRLGEWYFFERGRGAFLDGRPPPGPRRGPILRSDVLFVPSRLHARARLDWPGKARNLGSIAAHLALVAAGAARGALVGPGWRAWDTAAGLGLIWAVGGSAARLDGESVEIGRDEGVPFVAGAPEVVGWFTDGPPRLSPRG